MGMKYSIIIPAYNEEQNLKPLVRELYSTLEGDDFEVILVDDNSSDGSACICDELARDCSRTSVVHRRLGRNGMGYALSEGSDKAKGQYTVWVMGDRSDDLKAIKRIISKLEGGYDLVFASRYMEGGSVGELEMDKAIYGSTYTLIARLVFGIPVHDITNAFRGFRSKVFQDARPQAGDFAISPEFAIRAQMRGFKLGEVPTTYFNRRAGQTKFRLFRMGLRYLSLLSLRFTGAKNTTSN
jgi:dolichol-phosphate mannosyltransferase